MLIAKLVTTDRELDQIAALSEANLVTRVSPETKAQEGFVTWEYTPRVLRDLHAVAPSVVVKDGDALAGYALTLTPACASVYPTMAPTLAHLSSIVYDGRPLSDRKIYLMGQICVAAPYRGQGVVDQLYAFHRAHFSGTFDMLVTEISRANPRSLKAHTKSGFKVVDSYPDNGSLWDVVLWDWTA
jgi:hypothetical protein